MDGSNPEDIKENTLYLEKAQKVIEDVGYDNLPSVLGDLLKRNAFLEKEVGHLKEIAERDVLTGLLNTRGLMNRFYDKVNTLKREQYELKDTGQLRDQNYIVFRGYSLLWIDMVGLKKYNDEKGWSEGDKKLIELSDVINASAQRSNDLKARLGGDDFLMCLINADAERVAEVVRIIQELLQEVGMGVSIGIAEFGLDTPIEKAIDVTNSAMNQAKNMGKKDPAFRSLGVGVFTVDTGEKVKKYEKT